MDHQADAYRTDLMTMTRFVLNEQCKYPRSRGDFTDLAQSYCSWLQVCVDLAKLFGLAGETNVQVNGSEPFSPPISLTNIQVGTKEPLSADNPLHCVHPEDLDRESSPWFLNLFLPKLQKVVGTPICIPQRDFIDIGRIASIENNHKPVDLARKGLKVAIKIVGTNSDEQQKMYGRHFEMEDELVSHISRRSIDDELSIDEWKLVVKLKKLFEIP
ncbi:hypothetical protein ABKV19_017509 [Rosa sericea]